MNTRDIRLIQNLPEGYDWRFTFDEEKKWVFEEVII